MTTTTPRSSRTNAVLAVALAAVLLGTLGTAAGAAPQDPSSKWTTTDPGFVLHSATADVNGDGVADVITAGAHRDGFFVESSMAVANPIWAAHLASSQAKVTEPPARLTALNGATGAKLWTVIWRPAAESPAEEGDLNQVDGIIAGALDGQAGPDVLVWRRVHRAGTWTSFEELYDGADGGLKWRHSSQTGMRKDIAPVQVGDRLGAVVSGDTNDPQVPGGERWAVRIVTAGANGLMTHGEVRYEPGTYAAAQARPTANGFRVVTSEMHATGTEAGRDYLPLTRAYDIDRSGTATVLWERAETARFSQDGHELVLTGGARPTVVQSTDSLLVALDEQTGEQLWQSRDATTELLGAITARDFNGDGVRDVLVSPKTGHSYYGAVDGAGSDFSSELVALEGRSGDVLWRVTEPLAKFGASALTFADTDGDGNDEVVGSFLRNDGFPLYGGTHDDPGIVVSVDPVSGQVGCRWLTERVALSLTGANVDRAGGAEILASEIAGVTSALTHAGAACEAQVPAP